MSLPTQPYKGARDFYPEDKRVQKYMFSVLRQVAESFGYQEYDAPILEPIELYLAKTGEEIVNEQLYSFEDKGGRRMVIRPEMTPSVSRIVAGRRQELAYPLRLYSIPNLWRYERPQRGRLREHWQLNVDLFGVEGTAGDIEIIQIADAILKAFGAETADYIIKVSSAKLLNELGELINFNQDQVHKMHRLADNKSKMGEDDFKGAMAEAGLDASIPFFFATSIDKLPPPINESKEAKSLSNVLAQLKNYGVNAVFDPGVVRGFDYYTDIVFEVFDTHPENNRSMFGGGRYDGLVELFGVEPLPVVGFGMGDVTLLNFLKEHDLIPDLGPETDAVVILVGDVYQQAQPALTQLRTDGINLAVDSSGRKLDVQLKHAAKSGVHHVLFIGEKELAGGHFKLRDLRKGEETSLTLDRIRDELKAARAQPTVKLP